MTNGASQGLFVVVAIVVFGSFVLISYLLFRDNVKPSLSGIFKDGLEQATDNLTGVTNEKYLNFSTTNGIGIDGLNSSAYNVDGSIKKNLKTLILPNTINSRDLVTIDFMNSNITGTSTSRFAGVEKIVGNSKLTKVTPILTYTEIKELDLSQTQVTDIGQSFLKDNKTVKKLTLGKQFSNFGYAPFQNSALEELTLTNITPITNLSQGLLNLPSKKITLNAPKELEEQLRSYESRFKKVNYY
ncbi:hypothetical protein I6I79_09150 [Enterococcus casseliflavus]|uniref:hypothetical protein n=1 Tax=Enterococcus casseliflavus TaxID=37734 RepID=UPI001917E218|nr:hypothetical protein [Enterococcus casseliflavus]QQU18048.1 hypothetical protein I6I79_09150 [Enterococcus casseliflavus]